MDANIKNILLAGIGSMAYTYEKASNMVDMLVKKGELTVSQGKELNEELKKVIDPELLKDIISQLNLPTKADIDELKTRIDNIEKNN